MSDETSYAAGPVVDHHCHGLVLRDLDRAGFEALMNEGAGAGRWTGSPFDSMPDSSVPNAITSTAVTKVK